MYEGYAWLIETNKIFIQPLSTELVLSITNKPVTIASVNHVKYSIINVTSKQTVLCSILITT